MHVPDYGIYECKARGIFRKDNISPLIGDNVSIEVIDSREMTGNIIHIKKRENSLIRPAVANISQIILVFASDNPKPSFNLIDRFLVMAMLNNIKAIMCFNKIDYSEPSEVDYYKSIYEKAGYPVYLTSVKGNLGIKELEKSLFNETTVFAGPSGVGKSSLLNVIQKEVALETGEISEKIKRGRHTTRHAELICFHYNSYVVDTPGFSSLSIDQIEKDALKQYFLEFPRYEDGCRFSSCNHINEPGCAVKTAMENEEISLSRYESYRTLFNELNDIKKKW